MVRVAQVFAAFGLTATCAAAFGVGYVAVRPAPSPEDDIKALGGAFVQYAWEDTDQSEAPAFCRHARHQMGWTAAREKVTSLCLRPRDFVTKHGPPGKRVSITLGE